VEAGEIEGAGSAVTSFQAPPDVVGPAVLYLKSGGKRK
jgi:predicted metalloprotease